MAFALDFGTEMSQLSGSVLSVAHVYFPYPLSSLNSSTLELLFCVDVPGSLMKKGEVLKTVSLLRNRFTFTSECGVL